MPDINSLSSLRLLDDLADRKTSLHRIHPVMKLVVTMLYIVVVVSFDRYEITALLPFVFYPVVVFALAEIPVAPVLKRILWAAPLIIGIGIWNPVFDHTAVQLFGIIVTRGWVTFLSIMIKGVLTVTVSILLIATTGMTKLGATLRTLGVPKIFVLQLLMTYRYISVLIEEIARMSRAYALRAPGQKGVKMRDWGSFAGSLTLRTFDRAQHVYESMVLRGFSGEYNTGVVARPNLSDFVYLTGWSLLFAAARFYDLPVLLGSLFTGVVSK